MAWLGRGKTKTATLQPKKKAPAPAAPLTDVDRRAMETRPRDS